MSDNKKITIVNYLPLGRVAGVKNVVKAVDDPAIQVGVIRDSTHDNDGTCDVEVIFDQSTFTSTTWRLKAVVSLQFGAYDVITIGGSRMWGYEHVIEPYARYDHDMTYLVDADEWNFDIAAACLDSDKPAENGDSWAVITDGFQDFVYTTQRVDAQFGETCYPYQSFQTYQDVCSTVKNIARGSALYDSSGVGPSPAKRTVVVRDVAIENLPSLLQSHLKVVTVSGCNCIDLEVIETDVACGVSVVKLTFDQSKFIDRTTINKWWLVATISEMNLAGVSIYGVASIDNDRPLWGINKVPSGSGYPYADYKAGVYYVPSLNWCVDVPSMSGSKLAGPWCVISDGREERVMRAEMVVGQYTIDVDPYHWLCEFNGLVADAMRLRKVSGDDNSPSRAFANAVAEGVIKGFTHTEKATGMEIVPKGWSPHS